MIKMKKETNITIEEKVEERQVVADNPLKEMFVNYVGEKKQPEDGKVTVEMITEALAEEFPEFVLVMAERNFLQGYRQAFSDIEKWNKKVKSEENVELKNIDVFETPSE
jgi:hypothetical protein